MYDNSRVHIMNEHLATAYAFSATWLTWYTRIAKLNFYHIIVHRLNL